MGKYCLTRKVYVPSTQLMITCQEDDAIKIFFLYFGGRKFNNLHLKERNVAALSQHRDVILKKNNAVIWNTLHFPC